MANKVQIEIDVDAKTGRAVVKQVGDDFSSAGDKAVKAGKEATSAWDRLEKVMGGVVSAAKSVASTLGGVAAKAAKWGVGIGAVATGVAAWGGKKLLDGVMSVGAAFETLGIKLSTLMTSQFDVEKSLEWISAFTKKTPFELETVSEAFVKLTAYGIDARKNLGMLGDVAAGMGKNIMDSVEMYADALTGEFERLKEFGIKAKTVGDQVTFSWNENGKSRQITAEKTSEGIATALETAFKRFKGGMESMSSSWDGMLSNLADWWTGFQKKIADSGLFQYMETGLKKTLHALELLEASGKLDEWAKAISNAFIVVLEKGKAFGEGMLSWGKAAFGYFRTNALPVIEQVADRMEIWVRVNQALIKSKVSEWWGRIAAAAKGAYEWIKKNWEDGTLKKWAVTAGESLKIVSDGLSFIKDLMMWLGENIGKTLASLDSASDKMDRLNQKQEAFRKKIPGSDAFNDFFGRGQKGLDYLESLEKLEAATSSLDGTKVTVDIGAIASSRLPFTEKLKELSSKFGQFVSEINNADASFTMNATGFTSQLGGLENLFASQVEKVMAAEGLAAASSRAYGPYSWVQKQIATNELAAANAGMDTLLEIIEAMNGGSRGGAAAGGQPISSVTRQASSTLSTGDITINLPAGSTAQTAEDWRAITRNYIIPELQAARYGS